MATYEFQAEIKQLLNILAHSLYSHKEIFLRELISNASDALNKVSYYELTKKDEVFDSGSELCVTIDFDEKKNIIIIKDTGIGLTKEELINNLGTIAKSGTKLFLENVAKEKNVSDIIGQFGVGFYSAFVVASKVEVITKSYIKDEPAYKWSTDGTGKYDISEADKKNRGTEVRLFLKEEEKEFLKKENVENIIVKHSNFIKYPIYIDKKQVNTVKAIWTQQPSQLKDDDYKEFYKFIGHSSSEPLFWIHKNAEAPLQFNLLVFCPETNFNIFGLPEKDYGLQLYVNKVLIQEQAKDLIPSFLRFVKGVVDSVDIPLNISRESIQNNAIVLKIRDITTKSILQHLAKMLKTNKEKYLKFYNQYNKELKEGILNEFSYRDKISKLLLFSSTVSEKEEDVYSLDEYIDRKKEEQKEIYYISGIDKKTVENSPYLEIFKKKNIEVLYLTEPVDEVVLTNLMRYKEFDFKSIDQADLKDLEKFGDKVEEEEETKTDKKQLNNFIKKFKDILKDKVLDIVESKRLTNSAYCLVNPADSPSSHIQKIMKMMDKNYVESKKILEINPKNNLIKNMMELFEKDKKSELLVDLAYQIYDNAKLIEGEVPDVSDLTRRIDKIMEQSLKK